MIIEGIERVPFLARWEERWKRPMNMWQRFGNIFKNPAKAFWDIRHDEKRSSASWVLFLNAILFGLLGLAVVSHIHIVAVGFDQDISFVETLYLYLPINLGIFASFFVVGFVFYFLFFAVVNFIYRRAANFAGFTGAKKEPSFPVVLYALTPTLLVQVISIVIVLVGLPSYEVTLPTSAFSTNIFVGANQDFQTALRGLFFYSSGASRTTWVIIDLVNLVLWVTWIPILVTIALRELYELSTLKMFIGAEISSILIAAIFFATRATITGLV